MDKDKDTKDINGGLRVGTNNTSIRIGSRLIAGKEFDWSKLYDNLTLPSTDTKYETRMLIIANLSSHNENASQYVDAPIDKQVGSGIAYDNIINKGNYIQLIGMAVPGYVLLTKVIV